MRPPLVQVEIDPRQTYGVPRVDPIDHPGSVGASPCGLISEHDRGDDDLRPVRVPQAKIVDAVFALMFDMEVIARRQGP